MKIADDIARIPVSHIPREVTARALLSPRITCKSRRLFMRARDLVLDVPRREGADNQEAFCKAVRRLSITQLGRRVTQTLHKISEAERALAMTVLEAPQKAIQEYIGLLRYQIGWLRQEAERRVNGGKLA